VVGLVPRLKEIGVDVRGVRLDSGDLAAHARRVRAILDEAILHDIATACRSRCARFSPTSSIPSPCRMRFRALARAVDKPA
jgi:hypothetical protein